MVERYLKNNSWNFCFLLIIIVCFVHKINPIDFYVLEFFLFLNHFISVHSFSLDNVFEYSIPNAGEISPSHIHILHTQNLLFELVNLKFWHFFFISKLMKKEKKKQNCLLFSIKVQSRIRWSILSLDEWFSLIFFLLCNCRSSSFSYHGFCSMSLKPHSFT